MVTFLGLQDLLKGRYFDREVIILYVRWSRHSQLSLRGMVEMMEERGLAPTHTTIMRSVYRCAREFQRRWNRFGQRAGTSWRVDETYVKVCGEWVYLYRAGGRPGNTVDFRLSPKSDAAAAKALLRKAIKGRVQARGPRIRSSSTLDRYASHCAVHGMKADGQLATETKLRSSKYLLGRVPDYQRPWTGGDVSSYITPLRTSLRHSSPLTPGLSPPLTLQRFRPSFLA